GPERQPRRRKILGACGYALDAVEAGVMVTEAEQSCCVGLNANRGAGKYWVPAATPSTPWRPA
ncbi:hypothetical protein, partial [Hymenobacter coccineus]|uniref:hypothetical protein n=1 Tax=Hymenobacter coccineus TaxID=1908235 RepID=UPI001301101F